MQQIGNSDEDAAALAASVSMFCIILGVALSLVYIVTGIVYLTIDRDTCKEGDTDTDLW